MIAVEFALQPDRIVEGAGGQVADFHFQTRRLRAVVLGPARYGSNDATAVTLPPAARVGDHRFIAKQSLVERAIGQRDRLSFRRKHGEYAWNGELADNPAIN